MLKLKPNAEIRKAIARAGLNANFDMLETRLAGQKKITNSDLEALEGDVIEIDEPRWWNLAELASLAGLSVEAAVQPELADHEFWLIQFGLSIAPAPGHLLDWARFMVKVETTDGGAVPSIHSLFPGRPSRSNGCIAVARNFQFVSCDAATQALAEIEMRPKEDASITGILKANRLTWDLNGVSSYVTTYAIVRKKRTDQLRAEFSFHARLKIKGAEYAAAAQNWTMGGKVYVF